MSGGLGLVVSGRARFHMNLYITDDMMASALTGPEVAEQYAAIAAG